MKRRRVSKNRIGRVGFLPSVVLSCLLILERKLPFSTALPFIRQFTAPSTFHHRKSSLASYTLLPNIRGGDIDPDDKSYTAIGVQIVGSLPEKKTSASSSSLLSLQGSNCMILKGDAVIHPMLSCSRQWEGDVAALESLAICCDVLVIVLVLKDNDDPLLDPKFVRALEKGLQHRASNGMISSVLILLVSNTSNSKLDNEKDRLVLQDLSGFTPTLASLDLLSLDDPQEATVGLATVWKDILSDMKASAPRTTSRLVEATAFTRLLRDIYQSKGGNRKEFLALLEEELETTEQAELSSLESNDIHTVVDASIRTDDPSEESGDIDTNAAKEDASITTTSEEKEVTTTEEEDPAVKDEETLFAILTTAKSQIRDLETQQEHLWLGFSTDDNDLSDSKQGFLEFGLTAEEIIDQYQSDSSEMESLQPRAKQFLWQQVLPPLKQLYDQHLQFLREQYGRHYELALEQTATRQLSSLQEHQSLWKEAAAQVTAAFREAAQGAVPAQCQPGGTLRDANFDYIPTLEGLLSDMMQATEEHEEFLGIEPDEDEDDGGVAPKRRGKGPAKWYEKVAAKAFVFAVNYLQGWLAYQGLKRAAAQRDAHLPKFPLF